MISTTEQVSIVKVARSIEAFFELIAKLLGLVIVYLIFEFVGNQLMPGEFRSDTLLSLVVLPAIYVLKDVYQILEPFFVTIQLSDEQVSVESGILTRRLDCLQLTTVENVELITTPVGRLCGYSTLCVYAYGSWVEIPFVESPLPIKARIEAGITKRSSKDAQKKRAS
jgi:uncharacterized membrane protein YdbT with pleckstrin-like domain